ncbi:MAG: hypothetical protein ABIE75_01580 [Candidatus Omnitrophota bacterium]
MDKTKIIPIILLIVILGVGFVAFTFYTDKENLLVTNHKLQGEVASLTEANTNFQYKYTKLDKEKGEIERRLSTVTKELSSLEAASENWKTKWKTVSKERDELVEEVKRAANRVPAVRVTEKTSSSEISEDYWADFVKEKAALEVKLETLNKARFDEKSTITKLERENKELSIQADQLAKEKARFLEEIKFKERTLRIMSLDLVTERETRGSSVDELKKLRSENVDLKRELVVANKGLMKLEDKLKEVILKKESLENQIADADSILRDKSLAFEELQEQLVQTVKAGKKIISNESASVELPPIIVKPTASGLKDVRGEVIAVNYEEKFIVVDIGESAGLKPGALLKIIRSGKEIGTAEVIETRKEISAADIKEVVGGHTIQEGDTAITQ